MMAFQTPLALGLAAALSLAAAAQNPAPLTLVQDGQARCAILVGARCSVSERFAAKELADIVAQISGATLAECQPGQTPPNGEPGAWIVLGQSTARERHPDLEFGTLGDEGFLVKTIGSDLVIAGGEKRGTLYGVYSFLESLGCRWWADDASTIPKQSTLRIPPTDRREVPRLVYREVLYQEQWGANLWGVRNRITSMVGGASEIPEKWGGSGPVFHSSLVHSWRSLIAQEGSLDYENKAGKAQPAWYALVPDWQGKPQRHQPQPCTRNPQVRQAIIGGALRRLREHPEDVFVTVGQEDGGEYCHCTEFGCADLVAREGSASALVLDIANAAAERVAQEFPGKRVMAPAYAWGVRLPKTLRPRDNLMLCVAPIENDFGHPIAASTQEQNVGFRTAMDEWAQTGRPIWVWDYTTNFTHYLMPHPNLDTLAANLAYYTGRGVTGYMAQGSHTCINAEFSRLRMWVLAQALWNPDLDNRALVEEFCNGYYGAAGPEVLKYIDALHAPVRQNADLRVACYNDFGVLWLRPEVLAECEGHLRAAEAAVADDLTVLERVRLAHVPLQYVLAVRQPSSTTWRLIAERLGKIDPAAFASGLAESLDRFYTRTGKPWGMDESGGHSFADFSAYLRQWASRCGAEGDVRPPELAGAGDRFRLIHPWQIDQQSMSWGTRPFADPDASDGWAMRAKDEGWTMGYRFVVGDDFEAGKRYTLFVRTQCPPATGEGDAFSCGIYGKDPLPSISRTLPTQSLTPGRYQVFEIGTLELKPGHSFWICTTKWDGRYTVADVRLDCLWLLPAKE